MAGTTYRICSFAHYMRFLLSCVCTFGKHEGETQQRQHKWETKIPGRNKKECISLEESLLLNLIVFIDCCYLCLLGSCRSYSKSLIK